MRNRITLSIMMLALLFAPLNVLPAGAYHEDGTTIHKFADSRFEARWARTDEPVSSGIATRTWIWGPSPYTEGGWETYLGAPDDIRLVLYFDKSRMELTDPDAAGDDIWGVTQGLLALEMMRGEIQVGDAEFIQHIDGPSTENVAGDPGENNGPTYATMGMMIDEPARAEGTVIDDRLHLDGSITTETGLADLGVMAAHQVTIDWIDHTIASVFWDFMNSEGLVWDGQAYVNDALFLNPYYATGLPVTEAYWTAVRVDGVERDVLAQCFERRCLTYTPDNEDGWQVEAGNVGQHYYRWRQDAGGSFIASPPGDEEEGEESTPIATVELEGGTLDFYRAFGSDDIFVIAELVNAGYRGIESVERLHDANALEIFNAVSTPGTAIPVELLDLFGEPELGSQGWALPLPLADTGLPAASGCEAGQQSFVQFAAEIQVWGYPYVFLSEADGPSSIPAHWTQTTPDDLEPRYQLNGGVNNKSFLRGNVQLCYKQSDSGPPVAQGQRVVRWQYWAPSIPGSLETKEKTLVDPGQQAGLWVTSNPNQIEVNFRLRIDKARENDLYHIGATWAHPPDTIVWGP
jgi:hypothetical protein